MAVPEEEGILLLTDEKFDFDLSLSSSSANEDDEVFFGPVGHKERCIAASLELNKASPGPAPLPASGGPFAWSPLAGEKFVEVYKEARLLALQIESSSRNRAAHTSKPQDAGSLGVERFLQESQLKVSLFEKEQEKEKSPKSLKRETYYLSDSPLVEPLLLDNQPSMIEALRPTLPSSAAQVGPIQSQGPLHSSRPWSGQPGAAHPPNQAVAQKRVPSKLQLPRASSSVRGKSLHSATEKVDKTVHQNTAQERDTAPLSGFSGEAVWAEPWWGRTWEVTGGSDSWGAGQACDDEGWLLSILVGILLFVCDNAGQSTRWGFCFL